MENCIFCKISQGEVPAYIVYEDQNAMAFLDVKPHAKGHTVVILKEHGVTAFDYSKGQLHELITTLKKSMERLKEKLNPDGFNVGWNDGSAAGQVVPHLHVHIMPRYNGDGGGSMHSIISNPGQMSVEEVRKLFE